MAVTSFKEIHDGRDGGDTYRSGNVVARYTRIFRAVTNSNDDDAATILAYADCPGIGDVFPSDARAFCQSVIPRNEPFSKRVWLVPAGYSTEREMSSSTPIDDPPRFTWDTEEFQRVYEKDRDGDGVVNSAGEPFDPPIEGDDSRISVTIQANLAVIPVWWAAYRDAINNAAVTIDGYSVAKWCGKVKRLSLGEAQERGGITFRLLTAVIQIDEDTWDMVVQDVGFCFKDGDELTKIKIACEDGSTEAPTAPIPLDGAGAVLEDPTPATIEYLTFAIYNEKDLTALPGIT